MSLMETEEQRRQGQLAKQQFIDALLETSQQFAERARRMSPPMEVKRNPLRKPMQPVNTPPIYQTDPPEKMLMFRKGLQPTDDEMQKNFRMYDFATRKWYTPEEARQKQIDSAL